MAWEARNTGSSETVGPARARATARRHFYRQLVKPRKEAGSRKSRLRRAERGRVRALRGAYMASTAGGRPASRRTGGLGARGPSAIFVPTGPFWLLLILSQRQQFRAKEQQTPRNKSRRDHRQNLSTLNLDPGAFGHVPHDAREKFTVVFCTCTVTRSRSFCRLGIPSRPPR